MAEVWDAEVVAARNGVALAVLQIGMGLLAAAALSDWLFAAADGTGGALTMLEGLLFTSAGVAGVARPDAAARLLRTRTRVLLPILAYAAIGAFDSSLQTHYAEVAPALIWVAAVVSSPSWVGVCVLVSAFGYAVDLVLAGHPVAWLAGGGGHGLLLVNQIVDLAANAAVMLLMVSLLRRFLAGAPRELDLVSRGGPSLTPQLALAAGAGGPAQLGRADSRALVDTLSAAERTVLGHLATGLAPKQAARELGVSLATVRTHVAAAKRKTGARTVEQLVAIFTEASVERP